MRSLKEIEVNSYYGAMFSLSFMSAEVCSKKSSSDSKAKLKPEASKSKDVVFWTSKNPEAPPEGFVVRNKKKTSARCYVCIIIRPFNVMSNQKYKNNLRCVI